MKKIEYNDLSIEELQSSWMNEKDSIDYIIGKYWEEILKEIINILEKASFENPEVANN
jgi:hypothetical protein